MSISYFDKLFVRPKLSLLAQYKLSRQGSSSSIAIVVQSSSVSSLILIHKSLFEQLGLYGRRQHSAANQLHPTWRGSAEDVSGRQWLQLFQNAVRVVVGRVHGG